MRSVILIAATLLAAGTATAQVDDNFHVTKVSFDRLEHQFGENPDTLVWDAEAWTGGDYHKLFLKTEGEMPSGEGVEEAEVALLYSRAIAAFWDLQVGVRYDWEPDPAHFHAALGVHGEAPFRIELDAAAYLTDDGDLSARIEAEKDLLITQRVVLQPRVELSFAAHDEPERAIGRGLGRAEFGIRLRYEIEREFAPYAGIAWQRAFGNTAEFASAGGDSTRRFVWVVGVTGWF